MYTFGPNSSLYYMAADPMTLPLYYLTRPGHLCLSKMFFKSKNFTGNLGNAKIFSYILSSEDFFTNAPSVAVNWDSSGF